VGQQAFSDVVTSVAELRELVGEPNELVKRKQRPTLDRHCRDFIARSPFLLLGTANRAGECDVSPKGDAPGFVLTLDESTLVIPDRPGNRRIDSLRNIVENPRVGLLFMIPGVEETLRVNGLARIVRDEEILERTAFRGRRPLLAIAVEVEEAFLHCAKAFKRSGLWDPAGQLDRRELPSMAQMLVDQIKPADLTVDELDARIQEGYATRMY
jgi:PPOX class probable FMN-dependent enzyme